MSGKAKPAKHTAKEIAMKDHEAKMRQGGRGGGAEGKDPCRGLCDDNGYMEQRGIRPGDLGPGCGGRP